MIKYYVVRVVQTMTPEGDFLHEGHALGSFIECLRYAGLIDVHETDPEGLTTLCFDIRPPNSVDSKVWAEMNAKRMQSFGYNAVAAPLCNTVEESEDDNCPCGGPHARKHHQESQVRRSIYKK
jgi:hypothetical protein